MDADKITLKPYATEITAVCPKTNELLKWCGCIVYAETWEKAEEWLWNNEMGYCKVVGEMVEHEDINYNLN